jgi:hypothetical protein
MEDYFCFLNVIKEKSKIEKISYEAIHNFYSKGSQMVFETDSMSEPHFPWSHYFAVFGSFFSPLLFALSISFSKEIKRYFFVKNIKVNLN